MKTVIITVKGKGPLYWMENLNDPENYENVPLDEAFWDLEEVERDYVQIAESQESFEDGEYDEQDIE